MTLLSHSPVANEIFNHAPPNACQWRPIPKISAPVYGQPIYRKSQCACGGGCPECAGNTSQAIVQTNLTVSTPNDPYELEADRVAEQVIRLEEPRRDRAVNPNSPPLREGVARQQPTSAPALRRKQTTAGEPPVAAAEPQTQIRYSRSGGQPLPGSVRAYFEPRFGSDFGHVRVHHDPTAARALKARAFTVGSDIVFGEHQFAPDDLAGRTLLAHELTHVLQQTGGQRSIASDITIGRTGLMLQRAQFNDGCGELATVPEAACQGRIDVRATTITLAALAVSHLFIVFTDNQGNATYFRGGPSNPPGGGYGPTRTACGPYVEGVRDWDPSAPSTRVYEGPEACHKAQCMRAQLEFIANGDFAYEPTGPNSNSVVAHLLGQCGLPLRKPYVTAPGFNMDFHGGRAQEISGASDRRARLGLGVSGSTGDLGGAGVSAGFSIDLGTAFNQTLRFPLRIGAEYQSGGSGAVLGSASVGVEAPFLNLPIPRLRIPSTIGASAGIITGGMPSSLVPGQIDPLLGILARPLTDFGFDIGRARVSIYYQMEWLRNLQTNRDLWNHVFGAEVGVTF